VETGLVRVAPSFSLRANKAQTHTELVLVAKNN
jgi:hypothetical protein